MNVVIKIICIDCRTGVEIGSSNTRTVEDPAKVGEFLWNHLNHVLSTISYTHDCYSNRGEEKIKE